MGLDIASGLSYTRVCLPIVVTRALLTGAKITVSLLIHFSRFTFFFVGTLRRVKDIFGIQTVASWHAEGMVWLLRLLRPVVASLIAHTEGLANGRCVLTLLSIVELISESIQILSLDHLADLLRLQCLAAIGMLFGEVRLALLKAWMNHDLTGIHIVDLPVLLSVGRRSKVASTLHTVHLLSDRHVRIVSSCCDDVACSTDFWYWIGPNFGC